jgi:hypothetical protein
MLQFHGYTGIEAEEALSEMAGLSSFGAAGLSGFDSEFREEPSRLAMTPAHLVY